MKIYRFKKRAFITGSEFSISQQAGPYFKLFDQSNMDEISSYYKNSQRIYARHFAQTSDDVARLTRKYAGRVLVGRAQISDLLMSLGAVIDVTDFHLYGQSQLAHSLIAAAAAESDGASDEIILACLVHDIGKILALYGELPENVFCANRPIGQYKSGIGLENVCYQWNHDEFGYQKLKPYVPEQIAWLVRYHSIDIDESLCLMNQNDLWCYENLLKPFRKYDLDFKSPFRAPQKMLEDYAELLNFYFPDPIEF